MTKLLQITIFLYKLIQYFATKLENNYYLCIVKKEKSYGRGGFFTLLCLISRKNELNQDDYYGIVY
jgi:hypothetical protein